MVEKWSKMAKLKLSTESKGGKVYIGMKFTDDQSKIFKKSIVVVPADMWDVKKQRVKNIHPSSISNNANIKNTFNTYERKIIDLETKGKILGSIFIDAVKELTSTDQFSTLINFIQKFDPAFTEDKINSVWLSNFNTYLSNTDLGQNTKVNYRLSINKYLKALGYDLKLIPGARKRSRKEKMTEAELSTWLSTDVSKYPQLQLGKDIFATAFYLWGSRIGEVLQLKWSDIKDGVISYGQSKSRGAKSKAIQVGKRLQSILKRYDINHKSYIDYTKLRTFAGGGNPEGYLKVKHDTPYIFPLLVQCPASPDEIKNRTQTVNRQIDKITKLSGIDKHIRTHNSRHTFASIAKAKMKSKYGHIDYEALQNMLGHSDLKTTMIYAEDLDYTESLNKMARDLFEEE